KAIHNRDRVAGLGLLPNIPALRLFPAPASRMIVAPCRMPMRRRFVTTGGMMTPIGGRGQISLHQRLAAAVPYDLLVGHAVALADCPARKVRFAVVLAGRPMGCVRTSVARCRGMMMSPPRVMLADVDP